MKVRIGISTVAHHFADAAQFWRWVALCEASCIDSLWCSDQLISNGKSFEPMSLMAALSGATQRLQFGMNALVLPYRDPLVLAKQCATIDWLSGGRLLPVFGVGQAEDPIWTATGRDPATRGRQADEMLAIMSRLFDADDVSFEGAFYRYAHVTIAPKPVRRPLPLWIGGNSEAAIRRTARFGTGWLGGFIAVDDCDHVVKRIKVEAQKAGRPVDSDHFGVTIGFRFGRPDDQAVARFMAMMGARGGVIPRLEAAIAVGAAADIAALIERYVNIGVSKFVALPLAADDADFIMQTERLADEVIANCQTVASPATHAE
jgi:probable F420-dependent oxidoreductase